MISKDKQLIKGILVTLLIPLFIFISCATEPSRENIKVRSVATAEPLLSLEAVDKKISVLEELLSKNMVQEKDRVTTATLIADYYRIKALMQGDVSQDDLREIILTLFNNLSLFDERYLSSGKQAADEVFPKATDDLGVEKMDIFTRYINKDYSGVISGCNEMEERFGKDSITSEIGILLALSLAADGRFSEAIATGDKIIAEIEQSPDIIDLRAGLVQWLMDMGNKENAFKEYQKLIEDMDRRQAVLNKTTNLISARNGKALGSDTEFDILLEKESTSDMDSRVTAMLREIDNMKDQGNYTGARLLLLKWRLRTEDPLELTEISNALEALDYFEKEYTDGLKTDTKKGIATATKLMEEEDYESAINILDQLKRNGDESVDVESKRAIAVEKLINQERNRAAKIFLTAKKTNDIKKKKALLLSAQEILTGLIERYPSSGMTEKVKNNLDSVNREIDELN